MADTGNKKTRREFLHEGIRLSGLAVAAGALGALAKQAESQPTVWQIDPAKCIACSRCTTECVLTPSAVKCVHAYASCGYCKLCFGLFRDQRTGNTASAENNRCPVDAIRHNFLEDPYYQIDIEEDVCIGCAKCVKGCTAFGNGSLFMQIRHDRCANCNQCAVANACPAQAVQRVPASKPYLLKGKLEAHER